MWVYLLLIGALLPSDAATCSFFMNCSISSSVSSWLPFTCSLSSVIAYVISKLVGSIAMTLKSFSPIVGWSSWFSWCTYKYISSSLSFWVMSFIIQIFFSVWTEIVEEIIFMYLINVHVIEYISLPMILINFRSIIISHACHFSILFLQR